MLNARHIRMLLLLLLGALAHSSQAVPSSLTTPARPANESSLKLSTFQREFSGGIFERALTETFSLALVPDALQLAAQQFFDLFDNLMRDAAGLSDTKNQEVMPGMQKLVEAAALGSEPLLVEALLELARALGALRKPPGPGVRVDGRPATRRLVLSALLRLRLEMGPFSQPLQQAGHQVLMQLYQLHTAAVTSKGIIQLLHISKAGGTSMCQCAEINGCATESFEPYRNCMIQSFDDLPRWVSLRAALTNNVTEEQPWFLNFGVQRRQDSILTCAERADYLRQNHYNFYAVEYTVPEATRPCAEFVNVVVFRDPIKRLRSHIMWIQLSLADATVDMNLTQAFQLRDSLFWEQLMPGGTNNYYIRSLLGEHMFKEPAEQVTAAHVEAAMQQVLKYDLLVVIEQLSIDAILGAGLGWRLPFPHENIQSSKVSSLGSTQSSRPSRQNTFLPTDFEAMVKRNEPDIQVYNLANKLAMLDLLLFNYVTLYDRLKHNKEHRHHRSMMTAVSNPWMPCGYVGAEGGGH